MNGALSTRCTVGPKAAVGDPSWTASILDNLVNNALIHSGEDPRVEIEAAERDDISIWVTDRGEGVPPEARPKMFERFFQAHQHSEAAGSGLGLYLSRRLARLQGGDVVLEPSPPGCGARFRFDLRRSTPLSGPISEMAPATA